MTQAIKYDFGLRVRKNGNNSPRHAALNSWQVISEIINNHGSISWANININININKANHSKV
jgi:hypothetical protein